MGRINERKLVNEKPLQLLPSLAQALGLNEAIILQQLHYWLIINKSKERNFRDGYYWTYNSIKEWRKQFPFWNSRTIERALWKLEADGIVKTSKHNKLNLDRTKWYRIDYARLIEVLRIGHNGLFDSDKLSQWLGQYVTMDKATESDNMSSPIPETSIQRLYAETNGDNDTPPPIMSFDKKSIITPPLMENVDYPPGKSHTTNGLTSLTDKKKNKNPNPPVAHTPLPLKEKDNTPPLMAEGSPTLKTQNDSVESHPGASKVEPVRVSSNSHDCRIEWPSDLLNGDDNDRESANRDIIYVLDGGHAPGRPPELEGNIEDILNDNPSTETLELIRQWFETASEIEATA